MSGADRQKVVSKLWNEAQDEAGEYFKRGEKPPQSVIERIIVCQEAFAARDIDGERYFDKCRKMVETDPGF